jgi:hypothetical protein
MDREIGRLELSRIPERVSPPLNPSLARPSNYPPLFPDVVAYAQAIHMGELEEKAPALKTTFRAADTWSVSVRWSDCLVLFYLK